MRLSKEQLREAIETIYNKLTNGLSDNEVAEDMGLSVEEFLEFKSKMFEIKTEDLVKRPSEHIYVEYMIEQGKNLRDLTNMVDDSNLNASAKVGAIRARADILDKLLTKGQEFGLIHKEPDKKIIAGIAINELSSEKLKTLVLNELQMINKLINKHGDKKIVDLELPEIYGGEGLIIENKQEELKSLPPAKRESKSNKANTSKIHKGRRRVIMPNLMEH